MLNLVKMEWYKLKSTLMFWILNGIVFAVNILMGALVPYLTVMFTPDHKAPDALLSASFSNPFSLSLLMIIVFISAVSFLYSDFSAGFIKNIAGQVKNKGSIVISKFLVIGIHNLVFFIVGALGNILGSLISGTFVADSNVLGGILTMLLKWLLSMSISAILLFMTMGMRSKTFASILGVVLATGVLSLVYLGVNTAVANIFHIGGFDISGFTPDSLLSSVNVITNALVVNAIVVSVVFIALFLVLTYITFKKRDVK